METKEFSVFNWPIRLLLVQLIYFLLQNQSAFAATMDGRWHPGIGDASIYGWITVLTYLGAVISCGQTASALRNKHGDYRFWVYLAIFLLLLGINKQLDLQSWLTEIARDFALESGWYAQRKSVQLIFIWAVGLGLLLTLMALRVFLAESWRRSRLTWIGVCLLSAFILMRAASFHHIDLFINSQVLGLKMNAILENFALLLIIYGALIAKNTTNSDGIYR